MKTGGNVYDFAVMGLGGIGSAAFYAAAKTGVRVLGLERFDPAHSFGSSHGVTRIIRTAYYEHPNYVPLAQASIEAWRALEDFTGMQLMRLNGLLQVGPVGGSVIKGLQASIEEHQLAVEMMDGSEAARRYPKIGFRSDEICIMELTAGYLLVEDCVQSHLTAGTMCGGQAEFNTQVHNWHCQPDGTIEIQTSKGNFITKNLIVTGGPWSPAILTDLNLNLRVVRKPQIWYEVPENIKGEMSLLPCFLFEDDDNCFYGFPRLEGVGMKVAEHSGGQDITEPDTLDRTLRQTDTERIEAFLRFRFPNINFDLVRSSVCMYTMSPDKHFIVDRHPHHQNIAIGAGFSGHGFKFAPVIGEQLVRLCDGNEFSSMDFLKLSTRFNSVNSQ
ncbi:MAG TPA: N-methyl-L-tryptophan oxidase [Pirellulaceae bacterium]|nr:N-methyl-L-tryptophan oxidase [Pirellulaceae bacterium]HMP69858.1 N-methyl-L-tryptophan oxidase [Pirellulaceae bacterium]